MAWQRQSERPTALTCLSLFSGCGGLDLGFQQAGFQIDRAVDSDPHATAVYARNFGTPVATADLATSRGLIDAYRGRVDLVLAGPPCQGFSTAGRRELGDNRNALLIHAAHLAAEVGPRAVVIENVAGVLQGRHRAVWETSLGVLRAAGYRTATIRLNLSDLGVPQRRTRVFLFAWCSDWTGTLSLPRQAPLTMRAALKSVGQVSDHHSEPFTPGSRSELMSRAIGPGQKLSNVRAGVRAVHTWEIPRVFGPVTPTERAVLEALLVLRRRDRERDWGDADPVEAKRLQRHLDAPVGLLLGSLRRKNFVRRIESRYDLCHTFNGRYRRPLADDIGPTVDTKFVQARYFLHPTEHRAFSAREAARLQTFPDTFGLPVSACTAARLVGNAVPPLAAVHIARLVRTHLLTP